MIASVDIVGVKYIVGDSTRKYVMRKVARLDRYLPKHARKSVTADIKLKQVNRDHGNKYEAEVILNVPDRRLTAKDSTVNMMAAIDIVEAKLVAQLRKYKQTTMAHVGRRRLLGRAKRRNPSLEV
jgi:putative sigma-54 modulation protein